MNALRRFDVPTVPPKPGELVELAPRLFWLRLPLPTRLNHVNIYILEDEEGWTVFDAGIGDNASHLKS